MKTELVKVIKNDVFTDSMVIAEGTGNEHNSVTRIIRNYKEDFEDFGKIEFMDLKSKNPKGGRPVKIYLLNEQQSTLLMTYLGNSEMVRNFKKELVRQFYAMRQYIMEHNSMHWQATRLESKSNRRMETDEIFIKVKRAFDCILLFYFSIIVGKRTAIRPLYPFFDFSVPLNLV